MQRYSPERAEAFYRTLMDRVSALPGIRAASYASYIPLGGRVSFSPDYPASGPVSPDQRQHTAGVNAVSPGFFETFQLPIVSGPGLDARDAAGSDYCPPHRVESHFKVIS